MFYSPTVCVTPLFTSEPETDMLSSSPYLDIAEHFKAGADHGNLGPARFGGVHDREPGSSPTRELTAADPPG